MQNAFSARYCKPYTDCGLSEMRQGKEPFARKGPPKRFMSVQQSDVVSADSEGTVEHTDSSIHLSVTTETVLVAMLLLTFVIVISTVVFSVIFLSYPQEFGSTPKSQTLLEPKLVKPTDAWNYNTTLLHRYPCSETCIAGLSIASYYGRYCGFGYTGCPGVLPCDALDSCCYTHDMCVVKSNSLTNCACTYALRQCALCAAATESVNTTAAQSAELRKFGYGAPATRMFAVEIASIMSWMLEEFCPEYIN